MVGEIALGQVKVKLSHYRPEEAPRVSVG